MNVIKDKTTTTIPYFRLDAAVAATEGEVHLALVDIDDLGDLALEHDVVAVPTVVAMKGGQEVDRLVGLVDEDKLEAFVQGAKDKEGDS